MRASRYLFVSCASVDKPRLAPLLLGLLARGFELWIDNPYDRRLFANPGVHTLKAGENWQLTLRTALEAAAGVLVFWSADTVRPERSMLHAEAAEGLRHGSLIQLSIDGAMPPRLFLDRMIPDVSALLRRLGNSPDPVQAALADPEFAMLVDDIEALVDTAATKAIERAIDNSKRGESAGARKMAGARAKPTPTIPASVSGTAPAPDFSVFVNYRRRDCGWPAISLYGRLIQSFGPDAVFLDVMSIEPGDDYPELIGEMVGRSKVFLALIGAQWIDERNARRLEDPTDLVRVEIRTALKARARIIPILVDGAEVPKAELLPADIQAITGKHCIAVDQGEFGRDVHTIVHCLERHRDAEQRLRRG